DQVLCFLAHPHLHDHVAREELALDRDLLAVLDLDRFLGRDQRLGDQLLPLRTRVILDATIEQRADLVLVASRGLNRVPAILRHHLVHRTNATMPSTRISCRILSTRPIATPRMIEPMITARVDWIRSGRGGQLTLSISARVSTRKSRTTATLPGCSTVVVSLIIHHSNRRWRAAHGSLPFSRHPAGAISAGAVSAGAI